MEKEFINEENFIRILNVIKFNEGKDIDLKKGRNIIKLVKSKDKFDNFLTNQFLENYVKYIYEHGANITKYQEESISSHFQENDLYDRTAKRDIAKCYKPN